MSILSFDSAQDGLKRCCFFLILIQLSDNKIIIQLDSNLKDLLLDLTIIDVSA